MLGLTAEVVIKEARSNLGIQTGTVWDETDEYQRGVIELVATLLFEDFPISVGKELARAAIMSGGW